MNNILKRGSHFIYPLPPFWWAWTILILLSWLIYYPIVDNFFLWDDFLWLYRGKTLWTDPVQMFRSEGLYFDPLIYLSFWLNYALSGLNYKLYHAADITLHAINGILVFHFVKLISKDNLTALLSGIVFVSSFAASDAVFWPSSRVDLLAAFFSLTSIILFLKHLKENKPSLYAASLISYILALGAKGTPVVMPALLFFLIIYEGDRQRKGYYRLIPFVLITIVYLGLLWFSLDAVKSPILRGGYFPNFHNYSLAFASLFIPERILPKLNLIYAFALICGLFFLVIKLTLRASNVKHAGHIGLFEMLIFLAPVLALGDLKIASPDADIYYLLSSPSHRIYLASIGMSMFAGSLIAGIYEILITRNKKLFANLITAALLVSFMVVGCYENWQREKKWGEAADKAERIVSGMKKNKPTLPENSIVGIGNFKSFSTGFLVPMLKVYYDLQEITVLEPPDFYEYLVYPVMLSDVARHFMFVAGRKEIYDFTDSVRELLGKRLKYEQAENLLERERLYEECQNLALYLNYRVTRLY